MKRDEKTLREDSGLPGMKVLGFAFESREPSAYLPHTYIKNTVCYTGTTGGNWTWRALPGTMDHALAEKICKLTALYGRLENKEN